MRSDRRRDKSWDLRVACALISLDVVEPFLAEMGFSHDEGAAARQVARTYVIEWRSREVVRSDESIGGTALDPEVWLASVRESHGAFVAERIARLSDDLATRGPNHLPWIELMVKLEDEATLSSGPQLTRGRLAWLRDAARIYLAESDHIHGRIVTLGSAKLSPWDRQFLSDDFYPADSAKDTGADFDPGAWLWAWLDDRHWQRFREQLQSNLSPREIQELVSWGNGVIDSRWSLSHAL